MRTRTVLTLLALIAACSSSYPPPKAAQHTAPDTTTAAPAVPTVTPAAPSASGYNIASGDKTAPAATAHAKVAIPPSTGYVIAVDQRFIPIRAPGTAGIGVIAGQDVVVNATVNPSYEGTDPFGPRKLTNVGPAGSYVDNMSGQIVAKAVVDAWFAAWAKLATANPSWTPKQIQDAIASGSY